MLLILQLLIIVTSLSLLFEVSIGYMWADHAAFTFWRATNDKQTTIVWPSCLLPYPSAKEAWIVLASAQDSSAEWEDLTAFTFLAPNWTTPLLNKRVWPSFLYNSLSLTQDSSTGWEDLALSGTWRIINQSCPQAISASLDLWYVYWSHPHYI